MPAAEIVLILFVMPVNPFLILSKCSLLLQGNGWVGVSATWNLTSAGGTLYDLGVAMDLSFVPVFIWQRFKTYWLILIFLPTRRLLLGL